MICRDKIGNLHTSYEKMGDSYHLKAFFGVNVSCAMNEVLKFPGLFKLEELGEYLSNVLVISKNKSISFSGHNSFLSPKYLAEDIAIKPRLVSISGTGNGIFYFYFDQHFAIEQKRKYKVVVNVIDKSIQKSIDARDKIIESNKVFSNISSQSVISEDIFSNMKEIASLAESIQRKEKQIYKQVMTSTTVNTEIITDFVSELKKEVTYINNRLGYTNKKYRGSSVKDWPEKIGLNTITTFEKAFKKEVSFIFKQEYVNSTSIASVPNIPFVRADIQNSIDFLKINKILIKEEQSLPSFDASYSKKHLYEQQQTLKNKGENYNLSFVNKIDKKSEKVEKSFTEKVAKEPIYVLNGHNENNVTAEIFIPLEEVRENLRTNASYLCKTEMVESENQYFILGL